MAAQTASNPSLKVGDLFPDLAKYELEGQLPAALKGKIVIIDFWASWCSPCQRTFPIMEQLHYRYGRRGLVIIAVNEDRSRAAKDEFIKEHPVTFAVVRDAKKKLAADINVPALPTSYVLDGTGRVRSIRPGDDIARNSKPLIKDIEDLLEQNSQPR